MFRPSIVAVIGHANPQVDAIMGAMIRTLFVGLFLCAAMVLLSSPAGAQTLEPVDVSALGPQVGETVPDFTLRDQSGTVRNLDSIMGERGAMIVFHRSADW